MSIPNTPAWTGKSFSVAVKNAIREFGLEDSLRAIRFNAERSNIFYRFSTGYESMM